MESVKADKENVDRVVLRRQERDKLESWLQLIDDRFAGMLRVTKSDLTNFLINKHPESLSEDELLEIERQHFDEVRWLTWALEKVRQSKREGIAVSLDELIRSRISLNRKLVKAKRSKGKVLAQESSYGDDER